MELDQQLKSKLKEGTEHWYGTRIFIGAEGKELSLSKAECAACLQALFKGGESPDESDTVVFHLKRQNHSNMDVYCTPKTDLELYIEPLVVAGLLEYKYDSVTVESLYPSSRRLQKDRDILQVHLLTDKKLRAGGRGVDLYNAIRQADKTRHGLLAWANMPSVILGLYNCWTKWSSEPVPLWTWLLIMVLATCVLVAIMNYTAEWVRKLLWAAFWADAVFPVFAWAPTILLFRVDYDESVPQWLGVLPTEWTAISWLGLLICYGCYIKGQWFRAKVCSVIFRLSRENRRRGSAVSGAGTEPSAESSGAQHSGRGQGRVTSNSAAEEQRFD